MNRSSVSNFKVWFCLFVLIQVTKGRENISDIVHKELVCGWSTMEAKCGFGDVIHFIRANYGRTSFFPCNDDNLPWPVNCDSPYSNEIVKRRCDKKWSCEVPATTSVFGDPCVGTEKYLEMDYECRPGNPFLLIVDSNIGVQTFDIQTLEDYPFGGEIKTIKNITAFDFIYRTKTIVWSDSRTSRIYSAPIESRGLTTTVLRTALPTGFAVDWIHDKIYWIDIGIAVTNLDGSWTKTIVQADHNQLGPIVVDPIQGWVFWIDWRKDSKIERAGMDGSHRRTIISTNFSNSFSMALDLSPRKIYWIDIKKFGIYSANYDGTGRTTVLTTLELLEPAYLSVSKDYLYWTTGAYYRPRIFKLKYGEKNSSQILIGRRFENIVDIKIFHNSHQPAGPNRCGKNNGGCSHLCLPTPILTPYSKPYRCVCPNHASNCSEDKLIENGDESNISSKVVVVPFVMTALLVLIALIGLLGY